MLDVDLIWGIIVSCADRSSNLILGLELCDEVLQSQLSIEHSTILPLFNDNIIKYLVSGAFSFLFVHFSELEKFLLNSELILESSF